MIISIHLNGMAQPIVFEGKGFSTRVDEKLGVIKILNFDNEEVLLTPTENVMYITKSI